MEIIYKIKATDGEIQESSLSHYTHSHSMYPLSFVADCSTLYKWENDAKIWK